MSATVGSEANFVFSRLPGFSQGGVRTDPFAVIWLGPLTPAVLVYLLNRAPGECLARLVTPVAARVSEVAPAMGMSPRPILALIGLLGQRRTCLREWGVN